MNENIAKLKFKFLSFTRSSFDLKRVKVKSVCECVGKRERERKLRRSTLQLELRARFCR